MEEVGEARYQTEEVVSAWKVKMDFFAERISLGGLGGEEHSTEGNLHMITVNDFIRTIMHTHFCRIQK